MKRTLLLGVLLVAFTAPNSAPDWQGFADQVDASFGRSIAGAGDVNGDGYGDVIVGAPNYKTTVFSAGAAFLYYGSADGLSMTASWKVEGPKEQTALGWSVAGAGDVNGDGYADVIVGAPCYDDVLGNEGRAYLYLGGPGGLSTTWSWSKGLTKKNALFGWAVAGAGDVNGDGFDDVIIGAPSYTNGQSSEGAAFVFYGGAAGLSNTAAWTAEGDATDAAFGTSVASAGDVNHDGYGDVIVGAPVGPDYHGGAYVYHGGPTGLTAAWSTDNGGGYSGGQFGKSVASGGDFNGDGVDDVIVGEVLAYDVDTNSWDWWKAHIYFGHAGSGLSAAADRVLTGVQVGPTPDIAVSPAGDVNADGIGDVAVGLRLWDGGAAGGGGVFVYHGSTNGPLLRSSPDWFVDGLQAGAQMGAAVGWGDVNGDGGGDLLVGAPWNDYGGQPAGERSSACAYHGMSAIRPSIGMPAQLRLDGTTEISAGGTTTETGFVIRARLGDPGRRPLRLEVEVKELAAPFDGLPAGLVRGPLVPSASDASLTFDALSPGTAYHWRARAVNDISETSSWSAAQSLAASLPAQPSGGSDSRRGCGAASAGVAFMLLPALALALAIRRVG